MEDCLSCGSFAELVNGACHCIVGYHIGGDFICVPIFDHVNYFSADLTSNNTTLVLIFTEVLMRELQFEEFTIDIYPSIEDVGSFSWSLKPQTAGKIYEIELFSANSIPVNSTVILTFLKHIDIISISQAVLCCASFQTLLTLPPRNSSVLSTLPATHTARNALLLSFAVSSVFSSNAGVLWQLIDTMQILSYIPLSFVPVPPTTRSILIASNPFISFPNPLSFLFSPTKGLPEHATEYGFTSGIFLYNCGEEIAILMGIMMLIAVLLLLKQVDVEFIRNFAQEKLEKLEWGYVVRFWIESYLPIVVSVGLQAYIIVSSDPIRVFSGVVGLIVALILLVTPYILFKIVSRKDISTSSWLTLTEEFAINKGKGLIYYPCFCLRRLLYAIIQLSLPLYPTLQSLFNIVHSVWVIPNQFTLFTWIFVQYQLTATKVVTVISELGVTVIFAVVPLFYLNLSEQSSAAVELVIWGVLGLMAGTHMVIQAYLVYREVREVLRKAKAQWSKQTQGTNLPLPHK